MGWTEVRVLVEQGVVGKQRMLEGAIRTNFNLNHSKINLNYQQDVKL